MKRNYTITTEQTLNKTSIEKLTTPGTKANKKVKRKSNQTFNRKITHKENELLQKEQDRIKRRSLESSS